MLHWERGHRKGIFGIPSTEVAESKWDHKVDCDQPVDHDGIIREFKWLIVICSGFADRADIIIRVGSNAPYAP